MKPANSAAPDKYSRNLTQLCLTVIEHRVVLWILLALPALPLIMDFYFDQRYYPEMMYDSGVVSVQLLVTTLAITPLMLIFRSSRKMVSILRWFQRRRRYLGLACFGYALIHLMIYLRRNSEFADVLWHMEDPKIAIGWIALLILLLLAITSNDKSVDTLGSRWKKLHRWVYFSTVLIFLHWALFGFFLSEMLIWLVPITVLQAWRLGLRHR